MTQHHSTSEPLGRRIDPAHTCNSLYRKDLVMTLPAPNGERTARYEYVARGIARVEPDALRVANAEYLSCEDFLDEDDCNL